MPDALDLLTICVEAGLGFDAAMSKVHEKWDNDLALEFGRVIQEIRLGKLRRDALRDMAERLRRGGDDQLRGRRHPVRAAGRQHGQGARASSPTRCAFAGGRWPKKKHTGLPIKMIFPIGTADLPVDSDPASGPGAPCCCFAHRSGRSCREAEFRPRLRGTIDVRAIGLARPSLSAGLPRLWSIRARLVRRVRPPHPNPSASSLQLVRAPSSPSGSRAVPAPFDPASSPSLPGPTMDLLSIASLPTSSIGRTGVSPSSWRCALSDVVRAAGWTATCVVPVPLGKHRQRQRGYNQVGLIAQALGKHLDMPVLPSALARHRETPSQVGLSPAERRRNVAGAFGAEPSQIRERTPLLLDDVFTTGATLAACAEAVRHGGRSGRSSD